MSNAHSNVVAFPAREPRTPPSACSGEKAQVISLHGRSRRPDPAAAAVLRESARADALGLDELWSAINEQRVHLQYQPQYELTSERTVSVEALCRLLDADGQLVFPDRFITLAESSGMIVPLGRVVIQHVCRDLASWRSSGLAVSRVAINLSAHQLNVDQSLLEFIDRTVGAAGLAATDLEFELTEREYLDPTGIGMFTLRSLAARGARIALDDFGVGYSSLAYLTELPVTTVKLDRSLVSRMEQQPLTERLVRHLVAMAMDLGITVVAEGIETEGQHDRLTDAGCHLGQGYHFSRPLSERCLTRFVCGR